MSKKRSGVDNGMVQLTLTLSSLPTAGLKAGALRVKDAVREALSPRWPCSREQTEGSSPRTRGTLFLERTAITG
jgi:hypothetical protein